MKIVKVEDFVNHKEYKKFFDAPLPICNLTTTIDVTKLWKLKKHHKFNCMMCFCVQNAGQKHEICHFDFNDKQSLVYYDKVVSNYVIPTKNGTLQYVSLPYKTNFLEYEKNYKDISEQCFENSESFVIDDCALVATSAVTNVNITSYASGYTSDFVKPFLVWGKVQKKGLKRFLNITFRFHHSIFAGLDVGNYFILLQNEINNFKIPKKS